MHARPDGDDGDCMPYAPLITQHINAESHMQGLTLFHALGKLLYNKRVEPDNPAQPSGAASQPGGSEKQRPAGVSAPRSQPSGVSQPSGGSSRGSASQPAPAQHAFGGSAAHSSQSAAMSSAASQPNGNLHSSAPAWSASAQRAQQQQHSAAEPDVIYLTDDPADAPMATAAEPEPPDIDARCAFGSCARGMTSGMTVQCS